MCYFGLYNLYHNNIPCYKTMRKKIEYKSPYTLAARLDRRESSVTPLSLFLYTYFFRAFQVLQFYVCVNIRFDEQKFESIQS